MTFTPSETAKSAYTIDYEAMYGKGYRGIIFDIDNTLVFPNAPADERSKELFRKLRQIGFQTVILSNNTGKRAGTFAKAVGADVVTGAAKPFPKKYLVCCERMHLPKEQVFFVGDQIYTDIWGANNAGIHSILVDPITTKEEFWIVAKRLLEAPVRKKLKERKDEKHHGRED